MKSFSRFFAWIERTSILRRDVAESDPSLGDGLFVNVIRSSAGGGNESELRHVSKQPLIDRDLRVDYDVGFLELLWPGRRAAICDDREVMFDIERWQLDPAVQGNYLECLFLSFSHGYHEFGALTNESYVRLEGVECAESVGVSFVPSVIATSTDHALRACPGRLMNSQLFQTHCIPREITTKLLIIQFTKQTI